VRRAYVPKALRERVHAQARRRCGYCLTAEAIVGVPMEIEHIIPESLGGATEDDNLWLACSLCNDHKNDRIAALDSLHGDIVRLFDPRHQLWSDHFAWTTAGDQIIGITPIGRATGYHPTKVWSEARMTGTGRMRHARASRVLRTRPGAQATWSRVAGRHHCRPAPSEPCEHLSAHTAQATTKRQTRVDALK